ncbi:MAG: aldehyde dehydrogenase family protein [Oscillospiraceae bacterium]|jgi:succinate-semialdehyde dehydrogenase/glutarate-semialdehyde dehydrogenase|nr:aldehyde dehydrogenase family protein [Oscillospiraceae bacterium]
MEVSKLLINGKWVSSITNETLDVVNPSTGEIIAIIPNCDKEDVDRAVQSAVNGFKVWRAVTAEKRAKIIHTAAELLRQHANEIGSQISQEMGKPLKSAIGEVVGNAEIFDFFAEETLRIKGDIYQYNYPNEQVQVVREPVGVVGAITSANYPIALLTWKLGAALAAGCSFVEKPDERSSAAAFSLGKIFLDAGLPAGVFNVISGTGIKTGRILVEHPNISKIAFTGSTSVGKEIAALAAGTCKRVSLELGGQCPVIIMPGIEPEKIVDEVVSQTFNNSGQYCYRINRAYIHSDIYDVFVDKLVDKVKKLKVGRADELGVDQGPLYHKGIFEHAMSHINDAMSKGARLLCGGKQLYPERNGSFYIEPTIIDNAEHNMLVMTEETFGPILAIKKVSSLSEAVDLSNDSIYGLAAFLYAPDAGLGLQAARQIESGTIWVNKIHKAYHFTPFGGMKCSGYGREKSEYGLDEYLELKTIYLTLPNIQ